jgi:glycerol-3-phosphate dehydrogenase
MIRNEFKEKREYDIIIIGGGITGASVAYEAASRGFSVALLERDDYGSKTSAATSKLIHGGLRYLANMEFGLVRESLRERRILENIAPNFVYPIANMIVSDRQSLKTRKNILKIGMILYDILSFDKRWTWDKSKKLPCHSMLSREETIKKEPALSHENLTGSLIYYDCASISPERLTLAFIKSAQGAGADSANYMEVTGFIKNGDSVEGVSVTDKIKNRKLEIKGKITINCAGPWADRVLSLSANSANGEVLRRSEGIHIITKGIVNTHLVTTVTPSGRHIFIIPWRGHSIIGTTDKEYIGNPDDWRITKESINELIMDLNASFGGHIQISYDDVLFCYGGLRPLVEDQTESVYQTSRKYEIYDNEIDGLNRLITVEGGKYTTSRNLAEQVMILVSQKMNEKKVKSITAKDYLKGCEIEDMNAFFTHARDKYKLMTDEKTVDYLAGIYGTELDALMAIAVKDKKMLQPLNNNGDILAQVVYAVKYESACTLSDIVFRRTGIGTLGNPGKKSIKLAAETAGSILKWDADRIKKEIKDAEKLLQIPVK